MLCLQPSQEVVAFYNGIRLPPAVVDARDWALNGNTITLGDDLVLDVPPPWDSTACYVASLGHKACEVSPAPSHVAFALL